MLRVMRISRAIAVLGVCGAALAACSARVAQPVPGHSDWPMYQLTADHNAVVARPGFRESWKYEASDKINSGFALVGNTLLFDTFGKQVVALDARNGSMLWHAPVDNIVMSTPIVAEGLVFVGTGSNALLNKQIWGRPEGDSVVAVSLSNGKRRWAYHTVGEDMPSPAYVNGRIVFANGDWHVYGLRADNGALLWKRDSGGASTMASATVAGGNVLVSVCANGIYESAIHAVNPVDGAIVWSGPHGHCDASATFADGKVFSASIESAGQKYVGRTIVTAMDAASGKRLWSYRSPQAGVWSSMASSESAIAGTYHNGMFYQACTMDDEFIAFDAATGKIRWQFRTTGPVKMSAVVKGSRLYVGDTVGILYTLDANTGKLLEARVYKQPFSTSPPLIAGQTLFVVNGNTVYALPIS